MKGIVFTGNRHCELRDLPIPEPAADEVRIRIMATGICGSDLSVYRGEERLEVASGHEASGVVDEVGQGVGRLRKGDRVSVHHHLGCGVCKACARGEFVACAGHRVLGYRTPGSFAEYTVAPERCCVVLPEPVSFIDGSFMGCVGATAYGVMRRFRPTAHETLAVFGLGPVGLSCVVMGKAFGLRVVGLDVLPHRLNLACQCGADAAIDASGPDAIEQVREFSRVPGDAEAPGVDYVVETSGSAPARRALLPALRREGKAAIVGVGSVEEVINPSDIHGKAAMVFGSVVFPMDWMWDLGRFLAASSASFEKAVTHRLPLQECEKALQLADRCQGGKIVFEPALGKPEE